MIRFENLTKVFYLKDNNKVVVDNASVTFPTGRSVALLGRNGAGKSTLLRMIAGTMEPTSGSIVSDGTISWPVGFAGSFHRDLSGSQNVRFIARIYGVDTDELSYFVEDFSKLGGHYHMPIRTYSSGMKSRLAFGCSMGIAFDTYLVDEVTSVGDASFRAKSIEMFSQRMESAGSVVVTHSMAQVRKMCDAAAILENGQLVYYDDLDHAISVYEKTMKVT